jgi:hypothetical protein
MSHFVLACSGPGAGETIAASERYSLALSLVSIPLLIAAAAIFAFALRSVRGCGITLIAIILHPVWSISAWGGDCGIVLRIASTIWIPLSLALLLIAIAAARRHGVSEN